MLEEREFTMLGRYPWYSTDAVAVVSSLPPVDGTAEMNKCLRCRKKECNNCLCKDKTFILHDKCEDLIAKGLTSKQICAKLHISRRTFFYHKKACLAV